LLSGVLIIGGSYALKLIYARFQQLTQQLASLLDSPAFQTWQQQSQAELANRFDRLMQDIRSEHHVLREQLFQNLIKSQQTYAEHTQKITQSQQSQFQTEFHRLQSNLREQILHLDSQLKDSLVRTQTDLSNQFEKLNITTEQKLTQITQSVEQKLAEGFNKTSETFSRIIQRLAIIDDAQKKITDLSNNVVSLQEILADKRSRGLFGEIQLNALVQNALPTEAYQIQFTLSNSHRVDCMLFLPDPTGHLAVDAKFPLENYRRFTDFNQSDAERIKAKQAFTQDIRKHINDIAQKYIIAGETADGAMMFIPAEAVFAEIHAHFPELVELAFKLRVWMASPTTMMAILTTARAVLKDTATRQQVHIIQKHLGHLAQDFHRFEKRMDNLAKHLKQANQDVEDVHISARKITDKFHKIEQVDLTEANLNHTLSKPDSEVHD